MAEQFTRNFLKVVVAQISQTVGFHVMQAKTMDVMVDILHRYLEEVTKMTHRYSEQCGRTIPILDDLEMAFRDLGINIQDIVQYVQDFESVPCAVAVPKFPITNESHLNFLKPDNLELMQRPIHVHEHLPPMHLEVEEQINLCSKSPNTPLSSPNTSISKRPGEPKLLKNSPQERSRSLKARVQPLREIHSVMMTTSGFLSPAREGKLPQAHIHLQSDSRSNSPQPPSYPRSPPEVKGGKKAKKVVVKKSLIGLKKTKNMKKVMSLSKKKSLKKDSAKKKKCSCFNRVFRSKPLKSEPPTDN